ncbi:Hypothetical predicted protein [Mytilus galloprovincialis]|uniref:Anticodon-binding domain-containing protein n=1 Tax=Mytilus galloprovincialis TaxID=29158 RepID=A0A8B6D2K5_MYTGA|nr:Hypothetical predicted protein [Mytilus galloprovincialis]
MEKQKNISSSSIIDLKAELFRKQEEFKQQKLQSSSTSYVKSRPVEKKSTVWSKQNVGVLQRAQKDLESKAEDENEYEKSRKALEKKSKLYEQISKGGGIPEEDGSKVFLVDFQKKVIDNLLEERNKQRDEKGHTLSKDEQILTKFTVGNRLSQANRLGYPYVVVIGKSAIDEEPKYELQDIYNKTTDFLSSSQIISKLSQIKTT